MLSRRFIIAVFLVVTTLSVQGCAGAGLMLVSVGAGTAASAGVNHTLGGITYKTFTASHDTVHAAALESLAEMEIEIIADKPAEIGRAITAKASDRDIEIEIEKLTPRTTRMRVVAHEDAFFKDSATATEIIIQTAYTLDRYQTAKTKHANRK